ncbi:MAG: DUF4837 family protein [Bacteroidales bacterium]|nr:DUF4837 family protein [Bacteroidales bacterium]
MRVLKLLVLALVAVFAASCNDSSELVKQNVGGKAGEIIIVANKAEWESEPGSELRSILATPYPYLPQSEPSYTLINIPHKSFTSLFEYHRNILILKVDPELKAEFKAVEDVWAAPQTVIMITAPTKEEATKVIADNAEQLFNIINQAERNRIMRNSKRYEDVALRNFVADKFGGSPYFPKGYSLKKQTDNFVWISYETTYINLGIFVYRIPYKDETSVQLEGLMAATNDIMQENVPGMVDNSYMTISSEILPGLEVMKYKNRNFMEMRGLWEVKNDFMGGPFVIHAFYDKNNPKDIIVVEGFVYAPRYDKRDYIRQVESILYSFDWKEDFGK